LIIPGSVSSILLENNGAEAYTSASLHNTHCSLSNQFRCEAFIKESKLIHNVLEIELKE